MKKGESLCSLKVLLNVIMFIERVTKEDHNFQGTYKTGIVSIAETFEDQDWNTLCDTELSCWLPKRSHRNAVGETLVSHIEDLDVMMNWKQQIPVSLVDIIKESEKVIWWGSYDGGSEMTLLTTNTDHEQE